MGIYPSPLAEDAGDDAGMDDRFDDAQEWAGYCNSSL